MWEKNQPVCPCTKNYNSEGRIPPCSSAYIVRKWRQSSLNNRNTVKHVVVAYYLVNYHVKFPSYLLDIEVAVLGVFIKSL